MPDEFTPEASVDFEAIADMAEAAASNGADLGDLPRADPPPSDPPAGQPPPPLDPFKALEQLVADRGLLFRELSDINAKLTIVQLQALAALGATVLLAVVLWRVLSAPNE